MNSKIYDRNQYTTCLDRLISESQQGMLPLLLVGGRRRLGKSFVPVSYLSHKPVLYCHLKLPIGASEKVSLEALAGDLRLFLKRNAFPFELSLENFSQLLNGLKQLFAYFKDPVLILHIDEFQELRRFEGWEGLLTAFVDQWREHKTRDGGGLLLSGSFWKHLDPLFSDHTRPLFGRHTDQLVLQPWGPVTLAHLILAGKNEKKENLGKNLLTLFAFTHGVPWYIELIQRHRLFENIHCSAWEVYRELVLFGVLRHEDQEILKTHFSGDAFQIFKGIQSGKWSRKHYKNLLAEGNYQNFQRFINRLNENYSFIDFLKDPILPQQTVDVLRIRDAFLYLQLTMTQKFQEISPAFVESARGDLFDPIWPHHEGWALEEIVYQLYGSYAAYLGWNLNIRCFGFRVRIENKAEFDIVSYSKEEKWIELIECKRSLSPEGFSEDLKNQRKTALLKILQKQFPKENFKRWSFVLRTVYVYSEGELPEKGSIPELEWVDLKDLLFHLMERVPLSVA